MTIVYYTNEVYTNNSAKTKFNTTSTTNVTLKLPSIKGGYNEIIKIYGFISDISGNLINDGLVDYYLDDTYIGSANVIKGISEYCYKILLKPGTYTIKAVYAGSNIYNKTTETTKLIVKDYPKIEIVTSTKSKPADKVTVTATVYNSKGELIDGGNMLFKLKGKAITNSNEVTQKVNVINGIAKLNYTLPKELSEGTLKITAVYDHEYYPQIEVNTTR